MENNECGCNGQLSVGESRSAVASISGYVYQIYHSVYQWLHLGESELLVLEGAEDFDVYRKGDVTATQVKQTSSSKLTLNSKGARDAVNNFWNVKTGNPNTTIKFHYLTTASVGVEKGSPFGKDISGIEYWRRCSRGLEHPKTIIEFIRNGDSYSEDLKNYLKNAPEAEVHEELIKHVHWLTDQPSRENLKKLISNKIVLLGEQLHVNSFISEQAIPHLLKFIVDHICDSDSRKLHRADLIREFSSHTTEWAPKGTLAQIVRTRQVQDIRKQAVDDGIRLSSLSRATKVREEYLPRIVQVEECQKILQASGVVLIHAASGMGKSTLAALIRERIQAPANYWITLDEESKLCIQDQLNYLITVVESVESNILVVLDNLNFTMKGSNDIGEAIALLYESLVQRSGSLVLTTQRKPTRRQIAVMEVADSSLYSIPHLTESDIGEFAENLGCESEEWINSWKRIIYIRTSGHPQLVHADLLYLKGEKWPSDQRFELLFPSQAVEEEKRNYQAYLVKNMLIWSRYLVQSS